MSPRLINSIPFRFMRWKFGVSGEGDETERTVARILFQLFDETTELDAAVLLAFDAVFDTDGRERADITHLYVTNDYVIELALRHRKILFGASIHPYRRDAINELERCAAAGAVLVKWLPNVQGMDPANPACFPFYDALARLKMPLLCHTGGEQSLPVLDKMLGDPRRLTAALERGVTVIAAHCGTRSAFFDPDWLGDFVQMLGTFPNLYGDTAALSLPSRAYAYKTILNDPAARDRIVHGSDWPILPVPPARYLGLTPAIDLMADPNWIRRDIHIKKQLGFDEAYWNRAAMVLAPRLTAAGINAPYRP
jgi:predicted TIM-barrel fold metal-dependent hydrolase